MSYRDTLGRAARRVDLIVDTRFEEARTDAYASPPTRRLRATLAGLPTRRESFIKDQRAETVQRCQSEQAHRLLCDCLGGRAEERA